MPFFPPAVFLFDQYPIGRITLVGEDSSFFRGAFGGIQGNVAVLVNAQLFSNIGTPIDGILPVVRIPLARITFVA
jgi:hypothetical protein